MNTKRRWRDVPECPKCKGAGWLWWHEKFPPPGPDDRYYVDDTQYTCDGEAHMREEASEACGRCGGSGLTHVGGVPDSVRDCPVCTTPGAAPHDEWRASAPLEMNAALAPGAGRVHDFDLLPEDFAHVRALITQAESVGRDPRVWIEARLLRRLLAITERGTLMAIRCVKHRDVPIQNRNEVSGGECGGCIMEHVGTVQSRSPECNSCPFTTAWTRAMSSLVLRLLDHVNQPPLGRPDVSDIDLTVIKGWDQ